MKSAARLRHRAGLALAVAAAVATSSGLIAASVTLASTTVADGARATLLAARDAEPVVRVAIRWAGTEGAAPAAEQDAAVRDSLQQLVRLAGLEPAVSIRSEPLETVDGDTVILLSDEGLRERVTIVDGTWPAHPQEVGLQVLAAEALGLALGDVIALPAADDTTIRLTVTALWEPLDARDPVWAGDPLVDRGTDGRALGPVVIDPALWASLETRPIAQWTAVLAPDRASPAALDELATGLPGLATTIDADERSRGTGVVVDGGLAATVDALRRAAAGVTALLPVAAGLVVVAAGLTLIELQRLLVAVRRDETVLLRSRGASPRRLTAQAAGEAAVIALPAATLGGLVGTALPLLLAASAPPAAAVIAAIIAGCALAVGVGTVLIALVVAGTDARSALRRDTLTDSGRRPAAVAAALLVLVLIAAVVTTGRFLLARGPLLPTAGEGAGAPGAGAPVVDLVAALATVILLVAGGLVAVALAPALARGLVRATGERPGLVGALVARPLARTTAMLTTPVLLIVVTVGALVLAGAVDATTRTSERAARELALGAPLVVAGPALGVDVRAELGAAGASVDLVGRSWTGGPAVVADLTLADVPATLVLIDPEVLRRTAATSAGDPSVEAIAAALAAELAEGADAAAENGALPVVSLPETAVSIRLVAPGEDAGAGAAADAAIPGAFWLADVRGGVTRVVAGEGGEALLPAAGGPWRVLALDVAARAEGRTLDVRLAGIVAIDADAREQLLPFAEPWLPRPGVLPAFAGDAGPRDDDASGFVATVDRVDPGAVRVMPDPVVPALVVTPAAAERVGAEVGDTLTARVAGSGRQLTGTVTLITPLIPGAVTSAAVAVDAVTAAQAQLAAAAAPLPPSALWLAPDAGVSDAAARDTALLDAATLTAAAEQLRDRVPLGATIDTVATAPAATLAVGARTLVALAALGSFALALLAVGIVVRAVGRAREIDVVVLRAVGIGVRGQRRARTLEAGIVLGGAALAGAVLGGGAAALLVGDLARALLVDPPPALVVPPSIDPSGAVLIGGLVVLGVGILALSAGRLAARQVRRLSAREVLR